MFERKIKYLELWENGERLQTAGFVRLEVRDEEVNIQVKIEKLRLTDCGKMAVILQGASKEVKLGEMQLDAGKGNECWNGLMAEKLVEGIRYEELEGIRIKLYGERELRCIIQKRESMERDELTGRGEVLKQREVAEHGEAVGQRELIGRGEVPKQHEVIGQDEVVEWREVEQRELVGRGKVPKEREVIGRDKISKQCELGEQHEATERGGEIEIQGQCRTSVVPDMAAMKTIGTRVEAGVVMTKTDATTEEPDVALVRNSTAVKEPDAMAVELDAAMVKLGTIMKEQKGRMMPLSDTNVGQKGRMMVRGEMNVEQNGTPCEELIVPIPLEMEAPREETHNRLHQSNVQEPLASTKWQQLWNIYPHITPFEDSREYLRIKPEDFVLLAKDSYPLCANSFLLHGYYNYNHIILCREMKQGKEQYYIGVPGNFYTKEKQVAVLFGFESFEGKTEPAKNSDFGYYMVKVEL